MVDPLPKENIEKLDALFREAVAAIDAGDVAALERLLIAHPQLARDRLESPGAWLREKVGRAVEPGEFFERPFLLWFVAEDPIRNRRLPRNIVQVAHALINAARRENAAGLPEQLNYAQRLVSWSPVARDCGVQIELMDVLLDAGAIPRLDYDVFVNHNLAAANHLVERGAAVTFPCAICLERWDDVARIAPQTTSRDKQVALVLASLNGNAAALARLLSFGIDLNAYSTDIYTHATALHHAVSSGSLEAVKVLVGAGANLDTKDRAWGATPLGWAEYCQTQTEQADRKKQLLDIAAYLRAKGATT